MAAATDPGGPPRTAPSSGNEPAWEGLRPVFDEALNRLLLPTGEEIVPELAAACRHAVLAGGKRLRPLVTLLAARACRAAVEVALPAAVAVELVHCYSLVHDDLPAMDDDDLRRGLPTCHKAFGEAVAILAGDALLTRAFEVLAAGVPASVVAGAVVDLAFASGVAGMVNGQAADVLGEGGVATEPQVRWIHERKTAALFRAAASLGARCALAPPDQVAQAARYGEALGSAFQVVDDLLGKSGDPRKTGKPVGKDDERGKLTYPAAVGETAARARVAVLSREAVAAARGLPDGSALERLATGLQERLA